MRRDMYENQHSIFDPAWYQKAFDQSISNADMLFNKDLIIKEGYNIPDPDGSRSSVFRKEAILNNTFNEDILKNSLNDIYNNSTHKLIASNRDNVNFFKWHGRMSDMTLIPSTNICEFTIPWNMFITAKERDKFKLSQFSRKWIKVEELINNWEIFKWHLMLFINEKVYSEYELSIREQDVIIRFNYNELWIKNNFSVYIYKFDTLYQNRCFVSRELCENQWKWKLPLDYISDPKVKNFSKVMVTFNKISDQNIRKDGISRIEVLGDNIEFLDIEDGYINLTKISNFNKIYIMSELKEFLWMTIIVPRFFHEYPILLPVDIVHRPYHPNLAAVMIRQGDDYVQNVHAEMNEEPKQVYIDIKNESEEINERWLHLIRPIVLSDAFENPTYEPYDTLLPEIRELRDFITTGSNIIEEFRFYVLDEHNPSFDKVKNYLELLYQKLTDVKKCFNSFYEKRKADDYYHYERIYNDELLPAIDEIKLTGITSKWFYPDNSFDKTIWDIAYKFIIISRDLVEKYYIRPV